MICSQKVNVDAIITGKNKQELQEVLQEVILCVSIENTEAMWDGQRREINEHHIDWDREGVAD